MRKLISFISFATGLYLLIRYRYRILNTLLKKRWIRTYAVKMTMQLPFIRNKMMNKVFRSQPILE